MDNPFFFFSKVLTLFLYPLNIIILLGIIGIITIKGYKNKIISAIPLFTLIIFSSFPISQLLIGILEDKYPPISKESLENADAIVVLGGSINILTKYPQRIELGSSSDRMTESIELFYLKKAPILLFTGGSGVLFQQDLREATFAKKFFNNFGIPDDSLILEDESKNTYENAIFSKKILTERKMNKIILVTSAFHMERSIRIFREQGFEVQAFPTDYKSLINDFNWDVLIPNTGFLENSTIAIKEIVGILVYKWKGYLK